MLDKLRQHIDRFLRLARLKPLSLAEKCRLMFGAAVLLVLTLALLIPHFWMGKLIEKSTLDAGRAVAEIVFENHLQISGQTEKSLPMLEESGIVKPAKNRSVTWLSFTKPNTKTEKTLTSRQNEAIELLKSNERRHDYAWIDETKAPAENNYVKIIRASDACIRCHNPKGSGAAFNRNQLVGVILIKTPAREIEKTVFMNSVVIVVAGLLAATGAMIAFYSIAQRIILRPIRQLRGLVNNVAEGNLDVRSAIKTDDEYEKLSDAFNHMLDGLQESQEKLRQANIQLDGKIAQLSDRNIELFKANKLKSEFLANMSHEFRTPLNAILGFAQLLREKPAEDKKKSKRYAENIIASGRSLLNMINNLLDLAKAEAGKMKLYVEKTSIKELCQGIVAFFSPMSEEKKMKIRLKVDKNIPLIQTDSGKIQQILYNLLSNAIKYTPEKGKVKVTAAMLDDKNVRISISDTGPGITEDDQKHIFEKFRQIDGSITRQAAGTGLGLAISKELANMLAGNITVQSQPGQGATFSLDIPIYLSAEPTEKAT